MALQTIQSISLDLHKNTLKSLMAKQYDKDTQIVEVKICDNGKTIKNLNNYTYEVKILSPDKQYLRLTQDKYITVNNEYLQILFPSGVFIYPGTAKVELVILQDKKQLSTMTFNFIIEASVYSDEEILADQELLKAIEQYKEELNEYVLTAEEYKDNAKESETNAKKSETNAKESEINAKTSEENAKESETNAKTSEDLSKHWAIGFQEEDSEPSDTNNSKYYAEKSQKAADYAAYTLEHAKDVIEITQEDYDNLSEEEKNNGYIYDIIDAFYEPEILSRRWAIGLTEDDKIPSDENNSKYYAYLSKEYSEISKNYTPEGYQQVLETVNEITGNIILLTGSIDTINGNINDINEAINDVQDSIDNVADSVSNLPKTIYSATEPTEVKQNDIWIQPY